MRKRRLFIVELEKEHPESVIRGTQGFETNFQNAILLSLLKDKKITNWQYERCCEVIGRTLKLTQ